MLASAVDFVLEGLYAQKKITRSDEFQYQAGEQQRRPARPTPAESIDRDLQMPGGRRSTTTESVSAVTTGAQEHSALREYQRSKYRYSKFTGDDLDEIDLEELLSRLSDLSAVERVRRRLCDAG